MKLLYILLISTLLLCGSGIASAANDTDDSDIVVGGVVNMKEVVLAGGTFWKSANENGNAGNLLLGIAFIAWIVGIIIASMWGGLTHAAGGQTNNADVAKSGTDRLKRVGVAIVVPPLLIVMLVVFSGVVF